MYVTYTYVNAKVAELVTGNGLNNTHLLVRKCGNEKIKDPVPITAMPNAMT
jgi:hypothetical protein